jgi:predicted transcriptional regulator
MQEQSHGGTPAQSHEPDASASSPLGSLQRAILEELWTAGESSVREVVALLEARANTRAYTTVLTVMIRLHARGLLIRRREGRRDLYLAAVDPAGLSAALSREAVDRLIDAHGDEALAAFAARMRDGDPADLVRLRELLNREDL